MRVPATAQGMRAAIQQAETGSNCAHVQKAFRALLRGSGTLRGLKLAIQQTEKDTGTRHIQVRRAFNSMRTQHLAAGGGPEENKTLGVLLARLATKLGSIITRLNTKKNRLERLNTQTVKSMTEAEEQQTLRTPNIIKEASSEAQTVIDPLEGFTKQLKDIQITVIELKNKVTTNEVTRNIRYKNLSEQAPKQLSADIGEQDLDTIIQSAKKAMEQSKQVMVAATQMMDSTAIQKKDLDAVYAAIPTMYTAIGNVLSQLQSEDRGAQPQPEHQQGFCNKWCLCCS